MSSIKQMSAKGLSDAATVGWDIWRRLRILLRLAVILLLWWRKAPPVLIVTGASANHFKSLCQFLDSVRRYEPGTELVIYDLGLSDKQRAYVATIYNCKNAKLVTFDFSKYPDFFHIDRNRGEFAWKPAIIKEVSAKFSGYVIWCDAGNKLVAPLTKVRKATEFCWIYSPQSNGTVKTWTHEACLRYLGVWNNTAMKNFSNRNGAIMAFNTKIPRVRLFIDDLCRLCCLKECIAPAGSNRSNHRQDQSVFTILYHSFRILNALPMIDRCLDVTIHQDVD